MANPVMVNSRNPIPVQADRMASLEDRLVELNRQIATGERFTTPSEDPAAANRAAMLIRLQDRLTADKRTLDRSESRLALAETAINTAGDALLRARELAISASTGTISAEDRKVILREVEVLQGQLLLAANTRDEAGRYVFAGASSNQPAYAADADGVVTWQGIDSASGAEAAGIDTTAPPRGPTLFGSDVSGAFASLAALAAGLAEPDAELRKEGLDSALDGLAASYNVLLDGQARVGAGRARIVVEGERVAAAQLQTKEALSAAKGLDLTAAFVELEALKLSLSASQSAFTRTFDGTLFDQLG